MSLIGARDMSVINTPPARSLADHHDHYRTNDQDLSKMPCCVNYARDGQAYIIHNRVETIFEFADRIKKLLPQARIVVGHGQ